MSNYNPFCLFLGFHLYCKSLGSIMQLYLAIADSRIFIEGLGVLCFLPKTSGLAVYIFLLATALRPQVSKSKAIGRAPSSSGLQAYGWYADNKLI
jgi:hypothetical protein